MTISSSGQIHCCFLLLCALYITCMYPLAWPACLLFSCCGIGVACMPRSWQQKAVGEICFFITAVIASFVQWYLHGANSESAHGLYRIIIVSLVLALVPNRLGLVRPLTMLVALELLLLDRHVQLPLPLILLLSSFALAALFMDAWLRQQQRSPMGVNIRSRWVHAPWRALLSTMLCIAVITFPVGFVIQYFSHTYHLSLQAAAQGNAANQDHKTIRINGALRIGNPLWTDQDAYIVARYFPDRSALLNTQQETYIRARSVPQLRIEKHGEISWNSPSDAVAYNGPAIEDIPFGSGATLIRFRSGDRFILRPDGSGIPAINDFYFDSELNLYRDEIDLAISRYRCALPKASYLRSVQNSQRRNTAYLEVPQRLQQLFQAQIPQLEQWRILSPEAAAEQILTYLHRNCRYSTKNLPQLADQAGECIRVFLFGSRAQRIGHCQYFASAATLLMRSCGHACRPVFGFASNEHDSDDKNSIIFRAWHAHAWTEFVNSSGRWQRLDATPADYLSQRIGDHPALDQHNPTDQLANAAAQTASTQTYYRRLISLVLVLLLSSCMVYVLWCWRKAGRSAQPLNKRQRQLAQQQHALMICAQTLGLQIHAGHTLSHIVRQLEIRSGLKLNSYLQEHLAALYNNAPIPTDWPIKLIKQAAQQQAAQKTTPAQP